LEAIQNQIAKPAFWQDQENSQKTLAKRRRIEDALKADERLTRRLADVGAYFELAHEGEEVGADLQRELTALGGEIELLETETLLSGENDRLSAIVTIHPGAGGTESQDWAEMLLRMYRRWAERRGLKFALLDFQPGEEAGLKSATFTVAGDYAYGLLRAESGVHRLVRISPFDAAARRQTSFASVFVSPEIDDSIQIEIKLEDLKIETYRSAGRGGQHVNTTDSAVRITHIPTGTVAQCQNERSQHRNREMAMKSLRSKLYELELRKRREASQKLEESKGEIAFGNQIRSYVLHPYRMVKDHRTKYEEGNADAVLDGAINPFINAYLMSHRTSLKPG